MKQFKNINLLFLAITIALFSCGTSQHKNTFSQTEATKPTGFDQYKLGKTIFRDKCAKCHGLETSHIDGPNIFDRLFDRLPIPQDEYFKTFVRNGNQLLTNGDPYIQALAEAYNLNVIHPFNDTITETEVNPILLYLKVANKITNP